MKNLISNLSKNWKTTLAGVFTFCIAGALAMHWIDAATAGTLTLLATGAGFVAAKDGNKTGV